MRMKTRRKSCRLGSVTGSDRRKIVLRRLWSISAVYSAIISSPWDLTPQEILLNPPLWVFRSLSFKMRKSEIQNKKNARAVQTEQLHCCCCSTLLKMKHRKSMEPSPNTQILSFYLPR